MTNTASIPMQKALLCLPVLFISFFTHATQDIEHIEVTGQLSTGLVESNIQLRDANSPDLRKQLSQLPGVAVNGNGMVSGIIQYRGLFGDRVKIKLDGMSIAGSGPNGMDSPLSHAIGDHQNIILHQGISSVSFGAETLGGAIELQIETPELTNSENWQQVGNVSAHYFTNNDAKSLNSKINFANNTTYFSAQGQFQEADNYESDGKVIDSTFYQRGGGKIIAGFHDDQTKVDFTLGHAHTNASGTPALAMDIDFIDALWYKLATNRKLATNWQVGLKMFGNKNEHIMSNFTLRPSPMPAMHRSNSVDSKAKGIDLYSQFEGNSQGLEVGFNFFEQKHNSRITNPNNTSFFIHNFNHVKRKSKSMYAEYEIVTPSNVNWQVGGRYTQIEAKADEVTTSTAMMNPNAANLVDRFNERTRALDFDFIDVVLKSQLPISQRLSFSASLGIKNRAPNYQELFSWFPLDVSAGLADGRNYIGNLDLKEETAKQIDIGLQYQDNGLTVLPNVFWQKISDYIIGMPTDDAPSNMIAQMMGTQAPLKWSNENATLYGIDLYMSQAFSKQLTLTMSTKWVRGKLDDAQNINGENLYRVAPLTSHIHAIYEYDKWTFDLSAVLAAGQSKVSKLQNETETSGYAVFNFAIHYLINENVSASLIGENLLDKAYADHLGGVNRINNASLQRGERVLEMGRNIGLMLEYQF